MKSAKNVIISWLAVCSLFIISCTSGETLFRSISVASTLTRTSIGAETRTITWTSNGLEGGKISALAIDPATPTILYAGTVAGVFKSTDGPAVAKRIGTLTSMSSYCFDVYSGRALILPSGAGF